MVEQLQADWAFKELTCSNLPLNFATPRLRAQQGAARSTAREKVLQMILGKVRVTSGAFMLQ